MIVLWVVKQLCRWNGTGHQHLLTLDLLWEPEWYRMLSKQNAKLPSPIGSGRGTPLDSDTEALRTWRDSSSNPLNFQNDWLSFQRREDHLIFLRHYELSKNSLLFRSIQKGNSE
jgi:hypothetical protein